MKNLTEKQMTAIEDLVFADKFEEAVELERSFNCSYASEIVVYS